MSEGSKDIAELKDIAKSIGCKKTGEGADPEELREVFVAVRTEVPGLVKDLMDAVYSPESAEKMAMSVAAFYKTLVESGIDQAEALQMAKGFIIDFRNLTSVFRSK